MIRHDHDSGYICRDYSVTKICEEMHQLDRHCTSMLWILTFILTCMFNQFWMPKCGLFCNVTGWIVPRSDFHIPNIQLCLALIKSIIQFACTCTHSWSFQHVCLQRCDTTGNRTSRSMHKYNVIQPRLVCLSLALIWGSAYVWKWWHNYV